LLARGCSQGEIRRHTDVDRKTIRRYARLAAAATRATGLQEPVVQGPAPPPGPPAVVEEGQVTPWPPALEAVPGAVGGGPSAVVLKVVAPIWRAATSACAAHQARIETQVQLGHVRMSAPSTNYTVLGPPAAALALARSMKGWAGNSLHCLVAIGLAFLFWACSWDRRPPTSPAPGANPPPGAQPMAQFGSPARLVSQPKRRTFGAEYRLSVLRAAAACENTTQVAELLRREGLASSHLTRWRLTQRKGDLAHPRESGDSRQSGSGAGPAT
jgi:hypothetical protein